MQCAREQEKNQQSGAVADKIRRALSDTGKKIFRRGLCRGIAIDDPWLIGAIVIGNPFLAPVLAIALAMIRFHLLRTVEQYEEQVKLELETGLSAITSSYERTMNLKARWRRTSTTKTARQGLFQSFLVEISVINPMSKRQSVTCGNG